MTFTGAGDNCPHGCITYQGSQENQMMGEKQVSWAIYAPTTCNSMLPRQGYRDT